MILCATYVHDPSFHTREQNLGFFRELREGIRAVKKACAAEDAASCQGGVNASGHSGVKRRKQGSCPAMHHPAPFARVPPATFEQQGGQKSSMPCFRYESQLANAEAALAHARQKKATVDAVMRGMQLLQKVFLVNKTGADPARQVRTQTSRENLRCKW